MHLAFFDFYVNSTLRTAFIKKSWIEQCDWIIYWVITGFV